MGGWLDLGERALAEYRSAWGRHGDWMAWNLFLAAVPVVLAAVLFRPARRRGGLWWLGVATFVAFLPNAPYVATDLVHLVRALDRGADLRSLVAVDAPLYATLIALGLSGYLLALRALRHYLRRIGRAGLVLRVEIGLHAASAVGVYLGRVARLNSWELVTRPGHVARSGVEVLSPLAVACTIVMFGMLVFASWTVQALHASAATSWRELQSLFGPRKP